MKNFVAPVFVIALVSLVAGCGNKKEQAVTLPPEQVLSGNAILAPQQQQSLNVTPMPVGTTTIVPVNQSQASLTPSEPMTLELTSPSTDKPTDKDIQQALANAGVYNGPVDGNIGPKSKKAIKSFQQKNGLNPDGKVGPRTWKKLATYLHNAPAVEPSMS